MSAFKWMDDKIRDVEQFVQSAHVAAGAKPTDITDPKETDKKPNLYGDALECLRLETQSSLENIKNDIAIIRMSTTVPSAAPMAQVEAPPPPPSDGRRPRWPTRSPAPNLCGQEDAKIRHVERHAPALHRTTSKGHGLWHPSSVGTTSATVCTCQSSWRR